VPSVIVVAEALADALSEVDDLTVVEPRMMFAPTPPAIDIYPATPAEADSTFGPESRIHWWIIRLRVATSDSEGVQDILLEARNPVGQKSIRAALLEDETLGGVADGILLDPAYPTGFQLYEDASSTGGLRLLGEEWRVGVMVSGDAET
jgi:hypothetical protein